VGEQEQVGAIASCLSAKLTNLQPFWFGYDEYNKIRRPPPFALDILYQLVRVQPLLFVRVVLCRGPSNHTTEFVTLQDASLPGWKSNIVDWEKNRLGQFPAINRVDPEGVPYSQSHHELIVQDPFDRQIRSKRVAENAAWLVPHWLHLDVSATSPHRNLGLAECERKGERKQGRAETHDAPTS
jgi:hypothetical protein